MNAGGALLPMTRNSNAPTVKTIARVRTDIGSLLPCVGALTAAGGFAAGGGRNLRGGGGQVMLPSLMTVRPRIASSSMLTLIAPSLVLQSSSARRNRLFE